MDAASQAVFMSIAAIASRAVSPQEFDGQDAPALAELSKSSMLRQGTTLCSYGKRREQAAITTLQAAVRVINENGIFTSPSLRSVAALTMMEMLILGERGNYLSVHARAMTKSIFSISRSFAILKGVESASASLRCHCSRSSANHRRGVRCCRYRSWMGFLQHSLDLHPTRCLGRSRHRAGRQLVRPLYC
jgi:hypothetical protein